MATITTYLLVSGPEHPETVPEHSFFEALDFELRETVTSETEHTESLTFVREKPLEEAEDLSGAVRQFSGDIPMATVVLCVVEERFDQMERLQMQVFRDGKSGGEVEHGYVFNVGRG